MIAVLAENSHPFDNPSPKMANTFGLLSVASRLLV